MTQRLPGAIKRRSAVIRKWVAAVFLLLYPATEGQTQDIVAALPQSVKAPQDNPLTADKAALGKLLFWDPILSGNKDVACASCHHPRYSYADPRDLSIGVN